MKTVGDLLSYAEMLATELRAGHLSKGTPVVFDVFNLSEPVPTRAEFAGTQEYVLLHDGEILIQLRARRG